MRLDCRWNRSYLHRSRWGLVSLISLVGTVGVKRFVSIRPSLSPPYTTSRPLCVSFSLPPSSLIHLPAPTSNPLFLLQQGWVNWLLTAVKARICIRAGFSAILISHFIICKYPQCSVNLFILTWNDPECCRTPPHHHHHTHKHTEAVMSAALAVIRFVARVRGNDSVSVIFPAAACLIGTTLWGIVNN